MCSFTCACTRKESCFGGRIEKEGEKRERRKRDLGHNKDQEEAVSQQLKAVSSCEDIKKVFRFSSAKLCTKYAFFQGYS